jgi:hypothetical protein
MVGA